MKDHFIKNGKPPKENRDCNTCPGLIKNVGTVYDMQGKMMTMMEELRASLNGTPESPGWMTRTRLLEERVAVLEERITNVKEGIIFRFENVERNITDMTKAVDDMRADMKKFLDGLPH
jgi:hypothetical protein